MHCSLISQRSQSDKTIFSFCESIELLFYTIFGTDIYMNAHAQMQKKRINVDMYYIQLIT